MNVSDELFQVRPAASPIFLGQPTFKDASVGEFSWNIGTIRRVHGWPNPHSAFLKPHAFVQQCGKSPNRWSACR
jgi:hypothetical protein